MATSNATTALAVIASAAPEAASAKHLSQWRARRSNQNNIQRRSRSGTTEEEEPSSRGGRTQAAERRSRSRSPSLCSASLVPTSTSTSNAGGASSTDESHAQERDLHQDEDPTGGIRGDLVALAERRCGRTGVGRGRHWGETPEADFHDAVTESLQVHVEEGLRDRQDLGCWSAHDTEGRGAMAAWAEILSPVSQPRCRRAWGDLRTDSDGIGQRLHAPQGEAGQDGNAVARYHVDGSDDGQERSHSLADRVHCGDEGRSPEASAGASSINVRRSPLSYDAGADHAASPDDGERVVATNSVVHLRMNHLPSLLWTSWQDGVFVQRGTSGSGRGRPFGSGGRGSSSDWRARALDMESRISLLRQKLRENVIDYDTLLQKWTADQRESARRDIELASFRKRARQADEALAEAERMRMENASLERELRRYIFKTTTLTRQLEKYRDSVPLAKYESAVARVSRLEAEMKELRAELDSMTAESERAADVDNDDDAECDEIEVSVNAAAERLAELRRAVGLEEGRRLPSRTYEGDATTKSGRDNWRWRSVRHVRAVISGRGDSDADLNDVVVEALSGYLDRIVEAPKFARIRRRLVEEAINKVQEHWSARHAIHVWDRLELSRSQMETLRHLLSFVYAYSTDKYAPIKVWQNPNDPSDYVSCPQLAARPAREKLYAQLCDESEIEVRENGRCERDAIKVTSSLYCNYALAMRTDFSSQRPARPIWFVDGTGGSLGRGVCHAEIGSADFTGDCYQSRATLGPLALYSGNDHAAPLRENLQTAAAGFNKLILAGEIKLRDGGRIPAEPILVADLQGVKCMAGQTESCHAVHCKCAKGDKQHKLPDGQFRTFEEVDAWISSNGCEFREFDWMCASAHFSPGVARGGRYTAFVCPHCDYSPSTEARWRADYKEFVALTDEEQAERRRAHVANAAHAHQELYMHPLLYLDMTHAGVDNLHLVYLNLFKHLFKYTVHEPLPDSKKKLVREYLKSQGYYSYAADADEDDPVKRWIGREVKRFLHEAHLHLPFLLQLAAAPLDVCGARASDLDADGREAMDADDEFDPTSEELQAEAEAEPEMMSNADKWDHFLALVRLVESKWDRDDDDYRKLRAVSWFNQMAICYADLMQLKPTMQSWVPHIALNIVTRQMVILGDPMRRSADACESYGAVVKKFIKHLTCRRTIKEEQSNHTRVTSLGNKVVWKQHFRKGFIQQAFSRLCVREGILHGESNQPFLQRADERQKHSGLRGSKIEKEECEPSPTVREQMLREADRA